VKFKLETSRGRRDSYKRTDQGEIVVGTIRHGGERPEARDPLTDRGSSFVEVLVAIILLGTIVVATIAGLRASIVGTQIDEQNARALAWLQAASDEMAATAYVPCHTEATPGDIRATYEAAALLSTHPTGWARATLTIVSVEFLTGPIASETWDAASCSSGDPLNPKYPQLVTIRVTDPTGEFTTDVEVIKSV
jgi:Tfp pilus assembly protein PilV